MRAEPYHDTVTPFSSLVVVIPIYRRETIYPRFGDWFAWVNLLLLMALIGWAMANKRVAANTSSAT